MSEKLVIGVDLDDVLWDFAPAWVKRYNEVFDDNVKPENIRSWNITQYLTKATPFMIFYLLEEKSFWKDIQPKEDSQDIMQELIDEGHKVYIVTSTSYKTLPYKFERLFKLYPFIEENQVIIIKEKQMLDLDVLCDDYQNNLIGAQYSKLLFDAPYNEDFNEMEHGIHRVKDWRSIRRFIKEKEENI